MGVEIKREEKENLYLDTMAKGGGDLEKEGGT